MIINGNKIGPGQKTYIIAEMSANHNHDFQKAIKLVEEAKKVGADAIKIQTYTPDTITVNCDNEFFQVKGTTWDGRVLYELYEEAYTPWEWQPKLKEVADSLGLDFISTPFDNTAVDFLESINLPAYKVASFELIDIPLLEKIASTGKPVIMSTGMASLAEIDEAVQTLVKGGAGDIALLKCTSSYPALPDDMNLKTIPNMAQTFGLPIGLSDHTLSNAVTVAAVTLGACVVEKHFILSRSEGGPDSSFSLEPKEFAEMVSAVRDVEKALGEVNYGLTDKEKESRVFRRSLFAVEDIGEGDELTIINVRSIRPGHGLHPRYFKSILSRKATRKIPKGTPISWELIG